MHLHSRIRTIRFAIAALVLSGLTLAAHAEPAPRPEPTRIVTLSPASAEVVAGMGWGDRIVGVTDYTDYPARVKDLPSVGSYTSPSLETIISLKPDLVVGTSDGNPQEMFDRLRFMGIEVFVLDLRWWRSIQKSIIGLGVTYGRKERGEKLVAEMDRVTHCIARGLEGKRRPRVLFAFDLDPAIVPGLDAFTNDLVRLAGGESISEGMPTPYPRLSVEQIIKLAPEVVVASTMGTTGQRASWERWLGPWNAIPAVRNKRLHVVDGSNLDRPSQRVVIGVRMLVDVLHPGVIPADACQPNRSLIE